MHKVLVFSYYWPPSGGPAVQRWLALSELLPKMGIEPIIITVHENFASYVLLDKSLNHRIPKNLRVYKTKSFEILNYYQKWLGKGKLPTAGFANEGKPSLFQKIIRFIRGNFFFPDPRRGWNKYAIAEAEKLIKAENIQGIVTAGPPHSTHLIGLVLKKRHNLFWLCDFHDAWVNVWYYNELNKSYLAKIIDLALEKKVLVNADKIITVGKKIIDDFGQKLHAFDKLSLHSMGYDDAYFSNGNQIPTQKFVLTYAGTMAANYAPISIFLALKSLQDEIEDFAFEVHFYGLIAHEIQTSIEQLNLQNKVYFHGYVPHQEVVKALLSSCLLLLVNPHTPQAEMIIPGKIYEYLATRLPILNLATHKTETAQIIENCGAGKTFERSEFADIKDFIKINYLKWRANPQGILNKNDHFKQYSRRTEAENLAKILNEQFSNQ